MAPNLVADWSRLFLALAMSAVPSLRPSAQDSRRPDSRRPNVVVVITDDQGYGDIAAHGNTKIRTPNLDALHGQSVRLTDFHVDPTCSPTRSALMTGRYSTRTGVWHTILGRSLMATNEHTIAETLGDNGYHTGMFGKWHLGENYPLRPQDQGFDDVVCHGGGGVGQGPDYWENDYFDDTYWRNGAPKKFEGYCTDVWFREAMAFIEKNRQQPFFCYLSTNAPHGPLNVDKKWSQPYVDLGVAPNQAKFYGMIENIDWNMGKLMAQLGRLGLAENTILVFMTDNGTAAGRVDRKRVAKGQWGGFNAGMRGNKGSEYDGGHRVPCFVRWPAGGIGGGRDEPYLAAHVDLLPTLAELCGAKNAQRAGQTLDGTSLAARLRDAGAKLPERTLFVHSQRILQPEKWRKSAVMTERWRLINGKELFDMTADPGQKEDVAKRHPKVVAKLMAEYDAWWRSLAAPIGRSVHIGLGSPAEPTTLLHSHDWQRVGGGGCPWHQNHVKRGLMLHGQWFVDVTRPGTYDIEFRRWPRQLDRSVEATGATLLLGGTEYKKIVKADAKHATFTLELPAGKTTLRGILEQADGKTRGPYFAYVTRREDPAGKTVALFNGKDLEGWHADVPAADNKPDAPPSFVARDGLLISNGKPNGHLITDASYSNYRLTVEYRWPGKPGNCGILVHASEPRMLYKMFPRSMECQMHVGNAGDFWCIGEDITVDDMEARRGPKKRWGVVEGRARRVKNLTDDSENELGQWNQMVIECRGDRINVFVNGDLVNDGRGCTATFGRIAIQAEGAACEFRKVELETLAP